MTNIETRTRQLATEVGAAQGRHQIDGSDLISLAAGWASRSCAHAADEGGALPEMTFALADAMEEWAKPVEQRFAGAIAKLCAEIAAQHPAAPGDAIRDAFLWTGWCHSTFHGEAVQVHVRLQGPGKPSGDEKTRLEDEFAGALLERLVTSEAVNAAYYGDNRWKRGATSAARAYWARIWTRVRAEAMAQVFPDGLPAQTNLRMRFSYSPW
jgi:hypothetical protein